MLPKIQCKNEHELRKLEYDENSNNRRAKRLAEQSKANKINKIPADIRSYWNNIERAVLAKVKSTTAATAAYNLKDIQGAYLGFIFHLCAFCRIYVITNLLQCTHTGVMYRVLSNVPDGSKVEDDDSYYSHEIPQLVYKKDLLLEPTSPDSFTTLPRLPFTGFLLDCEYALDTNKKWTPKPLLAGQFKQFLQDFNILTTCDDWVGATFCGFQQQHEFYEIARKFCHGNAEKMFWVKPLSRSTLMPLDSGVAPRNYNNRMECFVLCYYVKEGTHTGP